MQGDFYCEKEFYFQSVEQGVRGMCYAEYSVAPHAHDFYEINVVQAGKGAHSIEGRTFLVRAGDVFVIPPNTVHAYRNDGGLQVYHLLLHPQFFETYIPDRASVRGMILLTEIEPFLRKNGAPFFLRLTATDLLALHNDLEVLTDGSKYDYEGAAPLKRCTVLKNLYYWAYLLSSQAYERAVSPENEVGVMRTLEYIHKNFGEKILLEDLCAVAFMTRSTLLRHFSVVCGCTPTQYLQRYRAERATKALARGEKSRTDVAHECGFYDLSHMERTLKSVNR